MTVTRRTNKITFSEFPLFSKPGGGERKPSLLLPERCSPVGPTGVVPTPSLTTGADVGTGVLDPEAA